MRYGGYGDADPYSDYMSGGRYAPPAPSQDGGQAMNTALGVGSLGLNTLGTAVGAYGAYKSWQQQQEQMREEKRRYEEQQRIEAIERAKRDEQNRLNQIQGFGGYAKAVGDERLQAYRGAVR